MFFQLNIMQRKVKVSLKTVVRYVRDLSIVVAGIAVTLYASDRVSGRSEKRDLTLYLHAIQLEVEENIKTLEEAIERLQPSIRYSEYLTSHDKESLERDTLSSYVECCYSFSSPTFKTNAFEMFKNSGIMRLVNDKELLLLLWDVYDELNSVKETFDVIFPIKWEDIKREVTMILEGQQSKLVAPMYHFYYMGLPLDLMRPCENALQKSKEMLEMLEKELGT